MRKRERDKTIYENDHMIQLPVKYSHIKYNWWPGWYKICPVTNIAMWLRDPKVVGYYRKEI
jgi:hypothetical protein